MDKAKLKEAAGDYSRVVSHSYPYYATSHNLEYECNKAFQNGADWLMTQSLAYRLTEEEKEKIKGYLTSAMFVYASGSHVSLEGLKDVFFDIFGADLFTEK